MYKNANASKIFREPFKLDCRDIVSSQDCFEFTMASGKKVNFLSIHFSYKQKMLILKEIQKRGGLRNQDVVKRVEVNENKH